jgi:hypothetical protein
VSLLLEVDLVDNMNSTDEIMLGLAIIAIVALIIGMFRIVLGNDKFKAPTKRHSPFNQPAHFTHPGRHAAQNRRNRKRR